MAMSGILRPGFIQIRVLDMQRAVRHYVDWLGLEEVCRGDDGRVYLKAYDEFDHHSVVLREAPQAGMDCFAFKLSDDTALADYGTRVQRWGLAVEEVAPGEQPGIGRRLGFTIPSGHRVELYAEADMAPSHPQIHNPYLWDREPHGMRAIRFDHGLLYGPDIDAVEALFTEALDFGVPERIDMPDGTLAIWLSVSNKPHDIAFVRHDTPGKFHHAGFFLDSWESIGHAADIMVREGIPIDIGPTRHGVTRGQTIYFFDPSGNRNEVYAGGYTYYPDQPTRTWDEEDVGRGVFYYEGELNEAFLSVTT